MHHATVCHLLLWLQKRFLGRGCLKERGLELIMLLKGWGGGHLFDKRGFTLLLTATLPATKTHISFLFWGGGGGGGWGTVWVGMDLT